MQDVERYVGPHGVKRALVGLACGLAVGALVALVLPRDDGPRRRHLVVEDPPGGTVELPATDISGGTADPVRDPDPS